MNDHKMSTSVKAYHSCIILFLLIIALTPSAAAADTMFHANPEHNGVYDNGDIMPTNTELWRFTMSKEEHSSAASISSSAPTKAISATQTITLESESVKIMANKDSIIRSKPLLVTIIGSPNSEYYLWIKGTSIMTDGYDNEAPMITPNQEGVFMDTSSDTSYPIGSYQYQNGAGKTIKNDVGTDPNKGTAYYCKVKTSSFGTRTVEFSTTTNTKPQYYTFHVEGYIGQPPGQIKFDEVTVKVERGAVTIVAAGSQSYYLGEEIKLSGTNTETYKTYLFIMGPNMQAVGSQIQSVNPRAIPVIDGNAATFKEVDVMGDKTWSWRWGTSNVALDAGTYTVYAVSAPNDYNHLTNTAFGTVSTIIKKPFVTATASQSTFAQGDKIFITGTAEGNPIGVQIWVFGKNYADLKLISENADAQFIMEIARTTTSTMEPGQFHVIVQHPMQNNVFDIYKSGDIVYNRQLGASPGTKIFSLLGPGSLQGSDAAEALVQGINSPNVDDTYTKIQFLVEVPVISVAPIGDKHVGDKFTITAATNLAVDDEVLVQVYSSSFKPTQKSQSGEFSGATGTIKVKKGDSGMNTISFDVDVSSFKPDEYIVKMDSVLQPATGSSARFNILGGTASTAFKIADLIPSETPTQPSGSFNLLIIVGIILLLCIGGGGYYILQSRKPDPHLPPDRNFPASASEKTVTVPTSEKGIILTDAQSQRNIEETILNQINKIQNNPAVSASTKSELNAIRDTIHGINIAESENPLKVFALKQLDSINNTLTQIHQKGVVFARSPDSIWQIINAEKFVEAIVESDKFLANLAKVEEIYDKATAYRTAMPDLDIVSLYNAGKYASVIKVYEQKQSKIDQINKPGDNPRETLARLDEKVEKNVSVPDSIKKNFQTQDIGIHERSKQQRDIEQLFSRLHTKVEKLTWYAPSTTDSFEEARDQITAERYDDAQKTLQRVEDRIDALLECESLLAAWKAKGYTLPELERLSPSNADELLPVFQKTKQNINRLEIIAQELESKKSTDPDLFKQPETVNLVLSIEQNLKNPEEIETIEKNYQPLNNAIRQLEDKQKIIDQNLRGQVEKLQREAVSPTIRREIEPIIKSIRQNDIPHTREMLQGLAKQQLSWVNVALSQLRTDGAVVSHSSDAIREQIAAQNYGDAILESEQVIAELTRVKERYAKAKVLKSKVTEPSTLTLFESGKYEEFVRVIEEKQMLVKKVTDLKEKGRKLLVKSEQFGRVPEHVHSKLEAHDIPTIESGIKELETFLSTTKPDLTLTLDHTRLVADTWHKVGVQITNNGGAHASDVNFSFSPEFETKWINSINIDAGESTTVEIGILPKKEGSIPLEITAMYRDANYKKYSEKHKIWISVAEKGKIPSIPDGQQPQFIRAYEFYAGYIRVKISVKNVTPLTIHDVILEPDVDRAILYLERHEPEEYPSENERIKLGTINPGNDRTVSLYLEPIICAKEGTDVHCHVRYKDALGKPGSIDMEPLRIQIVCPIFETKEPVNIGMLKQLIEDLPSRDSKVFSVPRNLDAQTQLTLVQSVIQLHDIRHISTLKRGKNFESWYYGRTKVTQKDVVIKIGIVKDMDKVEITAYSYDPKDLTGLLAEIGRHVTEEISKWGPVQKIINLLIKDSVVQRTNLMSFCDVEGKCSGDVTIEDSVVTGSSIG